jgi:hypothetical protein
VLAGAQHQVIGAVSLLDARYNRCFHGSYSSSAWCDASGSCLDLLTCVLLLPASIHCEACPACASLAAVVCSVRQPSGEAHLTIPRLANAHLLLTLSHSSNTTAD